MGMRPPTAHVDADAVCAQCGTVNPEDTLICKVCGNNLRDQRAARLARGGADETPPEVVERRRWLSGVLAIMGIIVVLTVILNLATIEQGLVEIIAGPSGPHLGLWDGPDAAVLNDLAAEIASAPLTDEDLQDAVMRPSAAADYAGRFALAAQEPGSGLRAVGEAVVRREEDTYYFVGQVGGTEVRGKAYENSNGFLVADWGFAGFRVGSQEHEVRGAAGWREGGGFECYGESDMHENGFQFFAFPIAQAPPL